MAQDTEMYILIESGGEYEDRWKRNIAVSVDVTKLEAERDKIATEQSETISLMQRINDIQSLWTRQNSSVTCGEKQKITRWPAGIHQRDISDAMRKQRDYEYAAIKAWDEEYQTRYNMRNAKWLMVLQEFLTCLDVKDQNIWSGSAQCYEPSNHEFTIKKITLL